MYRNNRLHEVQAWGGESETLPPGEDYGFRITEVKSENSSKKGTPQMVVVMEVLAPESHKGRRFTSYYVDKPDNETCRKRMRCLTDAAGIPLDQQGGFDDQAFVNLCISGDIVHEPYTKEDASTGTSVSSTRARLVNERPFGATRDQAKQRLAQQNFQPQQQMQPGPQPSGPTMSAPPQQSYGGPNTSAPPPGYGQQQPGWGQQPAPAGYGGPAPAGGYGQPNTTYAPPPPDAAAGYGYGPQGAPPPQQQGAPPAWGPQVPGGYPGGSNGQQPYSPGQFGVGQDTRPSRPNPTTM